MKRRLLTLVLALALCLGSVVSAKADGVDIKVKGTYEFAFGWVWNDHMADSVNKSGGTSNDAFMARQRIRLQINFIINEYLQGVYGLEATSDWGRSGGPANNNIGGGSGGAMDADGTNIVTRWAYLDWLIPNTPVQVRMGIQPVALPGTRLGNPVLSTDIAGVVVSSPTPLDWLSVTAFWLRPYDATATDFNGQTARSRFDESDYFGIILPLSFRNIGLNVTPWFAFANVGSTSGLYERIYGGATATVANVAVPRGDDRTHGIVTGINFDFRLLDPLVFGLDVIYGQIHKADLQGMTVGTSGGTYGPAGGLTADDPYIGTRGWLIAATLDYKLDFGNNFSVTPGIFGWWASGDSINGFENGQLGRLPNLGTNGGNFKPTSFGHGAYFNSIDQWANVGEIGGTGTGTWGIGIQLANATFIKDLSHTLRFAYYRGTNDSDIVRAGWAPKYRDDGLYLTSDDSVFEINFDHQYKIYENLTAALELGWLHLNSDEEVWRASNSNSNSNMTGGEGKEGTNAWKAQLLFTFSF
jgi:hypothetical protein